jgi:uncharacterized membrane protein
MKTLRQKTIYVLAFLGCLALRMLPAHIPNVEPLLGTQMPLAKRYGGLAGFFFGVASIVAYDILTGTLGPWTLITAPTYGLLGSGASLFFKHRSASRQNFVTYAIVGTLFYDAVTGLLTGPLFFGQSFAVALVGQIPFTILHLVGSTAFAFFISPALYSVFAERRQRARVSVRASLPAITLPTHHL